MSVFTTSLGRAVPHCHLNHPNEACPFDCQEPEVTPDEREALRQQVRDINPDAEEIYPPTRRYNCHAYAYAHGRAWFCEPGFFLEDDFREITFDEARRGDVIVYRFRRQIAHSAVVLAVEDGEVTLVHSKWGGAAAVIHHPRKVIHEYGRPRQIFRRRRRAALSTKKRGARK